MGALLRYVSLLSLVLSLCSCQDRVGRICSHFGINVQQIHYAVVEKTENWYPNGDGELFIKLSIPSVHEDELNYIASQMKASGAIEMPMLNPHAKLITGKSINYVKSIDSGLYLIDIDKSDSRNYCLIVYNRDKRELVLQTIVY